MKYLKMWLSFNWTVMNLIISYSAWCDNNVSLPKFQYQWMMFLGKMLGIREEPVTLVIPAAWQLRVENKPSNYPQVAAAYRPLNFWKRREREIGATESEIQSTIHLPYAIRWGDPSGQQKLRDCISKALECWVPASFKKVTKLMLQSV